MTFVLATPIWFLGTLVKVERLPLDIPVDNLVIAFMPLTSATILVYREEGCGRVSTRLKRVFDYKRIRQERVNRSAASSLKSAKLLRNAAARSTSVFRSDSLYLSIMLLIQW
ncbi:MAG: hypothetical protein LUQ38_01535 [Methanotrichaceae archaeon]|nr:hypothetical protein [Methanotrichaceae archaeon]